MPTTPVSTAAHVLSLLGGAVLLGIGCFLEIHTVGATGYSLALAGAAMIAADSLASKWVAYAGTASAILRAASGALNPLVPKASLPVVQDVENALAAALDALAKAQADAVKAVALTAAQTAPVNPTASGA